MRVHVIGALLAAFLGAVGPAGCSDAGGQSGGVDGRLRAIHQLAARGGDEAVDQLAEAAHDADADVAIEAIVMLGRVGSAKADAVLAAAAASEPRPELRRVAVRTLAQRGAAGAGPILKQAVRSDPSPDVRGEAAAGLARVGNREDGPELVEAAAAESDASVVAREMAAAERLIGVHLPYDPNAPEPARREALHRAAALAPSLIRTDRRPWSCADEEPRP